MFARTLHAEWTKFRSIPGWLPGIIVAAGFIMALGLLPSMQGSCGKHGAASECVVPTGPGGELVSDAFTFAHRSLAGDGSITVRVAALTGDRFTERQPQPGLAPWAKAGLIIRAGTAQGSSYAAVMLTGAHGVRMQYDYTGDVAGSRGATSAPRWLRLTRTGNTITAAESADGVSWTTVGTAHPANLPATVEAGLFVTSPQYSEEVHSGPYSGTSTAPTQATGTFDHLAVQGGWSGADWRLERIGASLNGPPIADSKRDGDLFRVTGSGDIAPAVGGGGAGVGTSVTQTLVGTFFGLIIVVVIGTVFITAEYRRGQIGTTFTACPSRIRVLAAKAVVVGTATFVTALAASSAVVVVGQRVLRGAGVYVYPASGATEVRLAVGTAALLAVAAVLALGLGTLVRRSVTAITTAFVGIVLPYLLSITVLPSHLSSWLLRIGPAAAFAVQQAVPEYSQVDNDYTPVNGYFPLPPWAGFAVLAGWAILVLGAASVVLRRRDT
jgi:hypothetical protein